MSETEYFFEKQYGTLLDVERNFDKEDMIDFAEDYLIKVLSRNINSPVATSLVETREEVYNKKIKNSKFKGRAVKYPTKDGGCYVFDVVDGKAFL